MAYSKKVEKVRKVTALAAVIILILFAVLTLIFALIYNFTDSEFFKNAWRASAWAMIFVPLVLYAMLLIHKIVTKDEKDAVKRKEIEKKETNE